MERITIKNNVKSSITKVWELWTKPEHIVKWNSASPDWHTTRAENDLRPGGKFLSRMEAKDGSFGFDFEGIYDNLIFEERIEYTLGDGRKVEIAFEQVDDETKIVSVFDAESENPIEMQRTGWQAILDNFKKYAENQ